eukprot:ANDGO_04056.mRNA.1 hypothetical protein
MGIKRTIATYAFERYKEHRDYVVQRGMETPGIQDKVLEIVEDVFETIEAVQEITKEVFLSNADRLLGSKLGHTIARGVGRSAFEVVNQVVF